MIAGKQLGELPLAAIIWAFKTPLASVRHRLRRRARGLAPQPAHRKGLVEVDSGYNTTINRFDGGVPRCKVERNASIEVDESFTY